ncbi:methylaspartate ammonia-lyase [Amycolatopsis jejuensis]|uniref:methylaspartate ammonia-lyase n=1 Tax=Amycolatopsis jejuensis TaxID=330084 RepID=UPI000AB8CB0C|nr:methylaspartate ammonia-lyase [Amycolatopsis jejuensis]
MNDLSALTIADVIASPGLGGFFFDDQAAIKSGALRDGNFYSGSAVTPGYRSVREPAESVCVMLLLSDGYVARGDCASVQYSGVGGRAPRFHAGELAGLIETALAPLVRGLEVTTFRASAAHVERLIQEIPGLGGAASYGVSQALLDAASHAAGHHLMGRVLKDEWQLPGLLASVPLYAQSGDDRYDNVDKMIIKRVPVLPHGLINRRELVGQGGIVLIDYLHWIRERLRKLAGGEHYVPIIHLDVYGTLGIEASGSVAGTADLLGRLEEAAGPHLLRVEHPIDAGSRDAQIEVLSRLRALLEARGSRVQIVADEWANTVEDIVAFAEAGAAHHVQVKTPDLGSIHHAVDAVLACHDRGVGPFIGGTCSETDLSARASTHVGIATGATQLLAKPGMGVDEGLAIVTNEMNRAVRLDRYLHDTAGKYSHVPSRGSLGGMASTFTEN